MKGKTLNFLEENIREYHFVLRVGDFFLKTKIGETTFESY